MPCPRPTVLALVLTILAVSPGVGQSGSFGNSLVVGDGELIVGEPNNTFRPGIVYVYRRSGGAWQEAAQLRAPDAERSDGFGSSLARTGSTLFVAQVGGRIHVFERTGGSWTSTGVLEPEGLTGFERGCNYNGYCDTDLGIALAAEGDWLLVGDPGGKRRPFSNVSVR